MRPRWFSPGADDSVRLNLTESLAFIMEQISNFAPNVDGILSAALVGIGVLCALSLFITALFVVVRSR